MTEPHAPESQFSAEVRFGAWLREQRELRGVELTYVATFTRLSVGQLEALEAGNWEHFAAGVYLRGAVMNYARAIGADAEEILSRLHIEVPAAVRSDALPDMALPEAMPRPHDRVRWPLWFAGALLLISAAGLLFWAAFQREQQNRQAPETADSPRPAAVTSPAATPEVAATTASEHVTPVAPAAAVATPPEKARIHLLQLYAGDDSWVEIQADDNEPRHLMLRKGRKLTVEARDRARIRVGNAGGVTIVVDGATVAEPMGPPGAVRERVLSFE